MFKKLLMMGASFVAVFLTATVAFAQEAGGAQIDGMWPLAIAIGIGAAAFGGALGQAKTAGAALESIGRNPNAADKLFVPMLFGLAFIESLVLFTWVLMFMMRGIVLG